MSNVSTAHTVTGFDAKKSQALTGQRLAKVGYKTTAKSPAKFPSVCASVPFIGTEAITSSIDALLPHIRTMLESAQDGIVRSLYESSGGTLALVTDDDISVDSCIKFLEAESTGGRLSGDFLRAWFVENVTDAITVLIADKLGYEGELSKEQEDTIGKHAAAYRDLVASLAGGKTMLAPHQIRSLLNVLGLVDPDDTQVKLVTRLTKMLEAPKKLEEMLEL